MVQNFRDNQSVGLPFLVALTQHRRRRLKVMFRKEISEPVKKLNATRGAPRLLLVNA